LLDTLLEVIDAEDIRLNLLADFFQPGELGMHCVLDVELAIKLGKIRE
jgi:hypothetical protein